MFYTKSAQSFMVTDQPYFQLTGTKATVNLISGALGPGGMQ